MKTRGTLMTDASTTAVSASAPIEDLDSLVATANRAAQWSVTADRLKFEVSRARLTAFALTTVGASAATIAGQIPAEHAVLHNYFAGAGAVALAVVAFITGQLLAAGRVGSWVKVRAASEALKHEAFRYAARGKPYDDPATAAGLLDDARRRIDADLETVVPLEPDRLGSSPRKILTPEEYRATRVRDQIDWYKRKSMEAAGPAKRLRLAEFLLALAATVITALSTITGKQIPFVEFNFDLAALTALLTSVGGAILSHIEASRLDHLAASYAATARRLEDLDVGFIKARAQPQEWSDFVNRSEDILAAENQSWIAKWGPSSAPNKKGSP
jgi:hypothetical protein